MLTIRQAVAADAPECVRIRALTRENAVSAQRLASIGITTQSWAQDIEINKLEGWVCFDQEHMVGYCFGEPATGEVVVLALLPDYEARGLGRQLLAHVTDMLYQAGHDRLFLGCATDPKVRSHGFYRHLGWVSTGLIDNHGDEVLEIFRSKT